MKLFKSVFLVLFSLLLFNCSKKSATDDIVDPPEEAETVDKAANFLATGASGSDILGNVNYDELTIEVAYVNGFRPTEEAMVDFVDFLYERTFKQNITVNYRQLPSPGEETLSLQEIADLEVENRMIYNLGSTQAIYIYFADAPSEDDEEEEDIVTLGAVYRNTSMVIYESTIKKLSSGSSVITTADIESATINHEFGHLFGLVNLGTDPVNDHEDADAANHCDVVGCLMRAELQFGGPIGKNNVLSNKESAIVSSCSLNGKTVLQLLEQNYASKGAAAVPLDNECITDLQSNGGR